ncbi:MAG: replication-relaxation family protein [Planctomycetes bacterium]|nr:replication-relaxation family protein [Planctomycetota bacterium]MBL7145033.1 replication-relaxation family protein [Phycisphaerae bacterium]
MAFRLRERDCVTLECLADYRILTVPQLAAIFRKNKQVIRRRFADLEKEGFIEVIKSDFGRARGRPENLLGLTERGVDVLREKILIGSDMPYENVSPVSNRLIDHQLLLNWFRIHLNEIDKVEPRPTLQFWAYNSPFVPREPDGRIITTDYSPIGRRTVRQVKFTPDAVFIMTNAARDKSLLFFLEADCGTETLSSPQRDMKDIRQKILNYQWYFQSLKYKRYEKIFKVPHLHGFRVLFLSKTVGRLAALCKLTQEMQPSEFICLTEQERLFSDGAFAKIWARGGNLQVAQRSIIGRLYCRTLLA